MPASLCRFLLVAATLAGLTACSGGVTDPASTPAPGPLTITPSTATLYSELPTTFIISGGTPPYIITSSDQAAIPVVGTTSGSTITIVPNPVAADTTATLTVDDSGTATPVTAALTVRPRTINNVVTVTPSAAQPAACGTAVCAGGDAEVSARLVQNGVPLANRQVRFNVVSGDVRIITSPAGTAEVLSTTATTATDVTGTARVRVRVLNDAAAQTALLDITDLTSGFFQRAAVPIAPSSASPLNAQPSTISFTGPNQTSCATGISADVIVFGGRPPYQISQPGTVTIDRDSVSGSGGRFRVTANGQCVAGQSIAIVDSSGATTSVTVTNALGSAFSGSPLVVTPESVTLASCNESATVILAGGQGGRYFGTAGSDLLEVAQASSTTFNIKRRAGTNPGGATTAQAGFTDGQTSVSVTVTLTGQAAQGC
ncbi:MAG TPA: hypothetical protein VEC19_05100 [Usitatibacter sp.]|nr:hypothetical protein [Usitatibacter sp.]